MSSIDQCKVSIHSQAVLRSNLHKGTKITWFSDMQVNIIAWIFSRTLQHVSIPFH
jgi:hypothetical protein